MTTELAALLVLGVYALGMTVLWAKKAAPDPLRRAAEDALALATSTIGELHQRLAGQSGELATLRQAATQEDRRRSELIDAIKIVERERNTWEEKFFSAAAGHGNAHQMMMRERAVLIQQLRSAGKQPKVNPTIERVVAAYESDFAGPARAQSAGRIKGSEEQGGPKVPA